MSLKTKLKLFKYKMDGYKFVLQRTILAPLYQIKIPLSQKISFDKHVKLGKGIRIYYYDGTVQIKQDTTICNFSKFIIGGGKLEIGKECMLGEYGIYNTFADLIIGDNVLTADRVSFVTNIHKYEDISIPVKQQSSTCGEIVIGDGTWIGMNVTVLAGSHIGKNCVVAAHSVVIGDFPDFCVIGGIPSTILKKYNDETGKWEKLCI